ncbi:DNA topoisomerase 2-binding protein 1-like [Melitaea cinxia]|uniref:DNA topoisomerase 2-binding protein 1-like n=1 Tax=Melitaea cinxia TaxID=113334 RepID=UPI001E273AD7|nr:DNA topoisomerase 2-binding protein 1-like [Melitaea cinxia]
MNEDINITFIIPEDCSDENECSEEMQLAFTACEQHSGGGIKPKWVQQCQWKKFEGLTKRDVFVLSQFEGELFDRLKSTKCLLVGPRCLSCCLMEGTPIPSAPEPVFTIAMRGLVVTASGLSKQQKEKIKQRVHWMGGLYSTVLTEDTTHLVSDTVLSDKYIKSVERDIPVMSESWVDAVWEASLRLNVNGSSSEFDEYKLPPFANLQVTTSGISKKEKQNIMKLVNENGGVFSGAFQSETTDVVVLTKEGVGSEKYKAAVEYGKACVVPAWVVESARKGVCEPLAKYRVAGASTSSPLAEHRLPDMSLNFSRITNLKPPNNFVDESRAVDMSTLSCKMKLSQESRKSHDSSFDKEIIAEFENFDMSCIKKAGPIFDGFCIWVSGLSGVARERAAALISRCGGVRYDQPHERVTHTLATRAAAPAARRALPAAPVLSALWLPRSVRAARALHEAEFLLESEPVTPVKSSTRKPNIETASPMSKRNLQLLRKPLNLPPPVTEAEPEPEEKDELVNHYLSQVAPEPQEKTPEPAPGPQEPDVTEDVTNDPTEEIEQIFRGIKIEVHGLDDDAICEIGAEVAAAGGLLVAAGTGGSYALVPLDWDMQASVEMVTVFWIKDCLSQQELLPVQYYHRPVKLPQWNGPGPLVGVVASLSTYSGVERAFLDELAKLLGATTQLRFCRRNTATALASTHLICPAAAGDKYQGAVKWALPAVTAGWLLGCARAGRRLSERGFLVGDTAGEPSGLVAACPSAASWWATPRNNKIIFMFSAPPSPEQSRNSGIQPEPEAKCTNEQRDKENTMRPPAANNIIRRGSSSKEQTPKGKIGTDSDADMSPASRYIAMARQGLLGCDSQETPKRLQELKEDGKQGDIRTPPLDDALSTPNLMGLSPTTRRRLQAVRRGEMPSDPIRTPVDPFDRNPETPDSAFGAALRPGSGRLSPEARKRLWKVVNDLPSKQQDTSRDKQTPLSEIRNRYLAQFAAGAATPPVELPTVPRKLHLQDQADTPPPKIAKLSVDHSAGGRNVSEIEQIDDNAKTSISARSATNDIEKDPYNNRSTVNDSGKDQFSTRSATNDVGNNTSSNCSAAGGDESSSARGAAGALAAGVDVQLQRLNAVLTGRLSTQRKRTRDSIASNPEPAPASEVDACPESQPNTVGWDDAAPVAAPSAPSAPVKRKFMLSSNVDNREEIVEMIQQLGGEVSDGSELDLEATHLLCAAPGRSEKMLGSIAAGKWVLHPAYVARSRQSGRFLQEEEFEWGNPRATALPTLSGGEKALARAAHRWRSARELRDSAPFSDTRALLHVPAARRRLLARLLHAGGGLAVPDEPPYTDDSITVCFADIKRYPLSDRDAAWLISKRIPVCPPVLLSSYLTDEVPPDPVEHCIAEYRPK